MGIILLGGDEMVEELKNAQATFGTALAAHHTNIQSYMQVKIFFYQLYLPD